MPAMPPGMPDEAAPEAPPQEEGGAMTAKAKQAGQLLAELSEALNASPGATDQDKEKMAMVLNGFIELVESNLSQGPGQDAPQPEAPGLSEVPAVGGAKGVPMGPQSRQ